MMKNLSKIVLIRKFDICCQVMHKNKYARFCPCIFDTWGKIVTVAPKYEQYLQKKYKKIKKVLAF